MIISMHDTQYIYEVIAMLLLVVGLFVSHKLNQDYPCWVRMIVLSPVLAILFTLWCLIGGVHVAYPPDIVVLLSLLAIYLVVASRFTDRPWLDIRKGGRND